MQTFHGFTEQDFDLFAIPALEARMEAIKAGPRPKLEALGSDLAEPLGRLVGHPVYPITAKHQRRKVNPPNDTWVAWSANKRGYKMLPHFQVGLWHTHAFIQAGVIYEAQGRARFANRLLAELPALQVQIPGHYRWLEDYTQPNGTLHQAMQAADYERIADRLRSRKEADCMVGLSVDRAAVVKAGPDFAQMAFAVMERLAPLYALAMESASE